MSLTGMAYSESAPVKPVKPKMIKQYMLGEMLGEGSYGKVREAIDSNTLRRVAVKISDKRRLRKVRGAEEQQKREIAVQRKLSHRGVVEVIEVFTLPEKPDKMYIVLELVTGGSLQALLESYADGRLPLCLCHRLFAQLLDALEHCHAKGVIHRDIKPANLMITADGQLKVSDFGSAEMIGPYLSEDTLTKSSGTPAFHSPEVASGSTLFSGMKVDVWAAGVTLYLLCSGQVPFSGSSLIHLYENIAKGEYEVPPYIAAQPLLVDLLARLLAVDQEERIAVPDARQHVWLTEPEPGWEAEAAVAIREISNRIQSQKSTVLPFIAKQYEDEGGQGQEGARQGEGGGAAGGADGGGLSSVIAPACAGVTGAGGRIAAGLGHASELLARSVLHARRASNLSSVGDGGGAESADSDMSAPPAVPVARPAMAGGRRPPAAERGAAELPPHPLRPPAVARGSSAGVLREGGAAGPAPPSALPPGDGDSGGAASDLAALGGGGGGVDPTVAAAAGAADGGGAGGAAADRARRSSAPPGPAAGAAPASQEECALQ